MLDADKSALEARTRVNLLSIRSRELLLYTNNAHAVGTVGAITAGIAYYGLVSARTHGVSSGGGGGE